MLLDFKASSFPKMFAQSSSRSIFTPALFIALRDNNNGISDPTTSVLIDTSFPAIIAGRQYSAFDFKRAPLQI